MKKDECVKSLRQLETKKNELQDGRRKIARMREEEECNIQDAYRKLEEEWTAYGSEDAELGRLLEEERRLIDDYKFQQRDYAEQIDNEYRKALDSVDRETEEVQSQIRKLENEEQDTAKLENKDAVPAEERL